MTVTKVTTDETNGAIITKRQNDTTNTTDTNARIESGWGVLTFGSAASNISEAVTFNTAFATAPVVVITYAGDAASGTTRGTGGNTIKGPISQKVYGESTTGFTAHFHTPDGTTWSVGNTIFYNWIAVGK